MYKINIYQTLYHLLRVAIGAEQVGELNTADISWQEVYNLARKQGVLAIAFDGVMRALESDKEFAKTLPLPLKLQWINVSLTIEQRYEKQREVCAELVDRWAEQGIKSVCLKGMAFSTYYPVPNHRECGDFDCYLYDDYAKGNDIARALGARVSDDFYKHSEIVYRKVMIENHQYIVATRLSKKTKALNALLDKMLRDEASLVPLFNTKILKPSPLFNALFMTYHSHNHFLTEGIRLRHILDWALFLKEEQHNLDWGRFYAICQEQGLRAFVDVQTAIAVEVFGVQIENSAIATTSPHTERVLKSVMEDDDAIFSQSISKWRTRMLIVRNLFASRWKYKAFSDRGVLAKFFSLVIGYLFHTEE